MASKRAKGFTLIEIMIVVAVIGLLAAVALPNFFRSQRRAQTNVCIANLKRLYDAKALWAMEEGTNPSDEPTWDDLVPAYFNKIPVCPQGGTYAIGIVDEFPTCSIEGHAMED